MLNYIWLGMLVLGLFVGIINGKIEVVTQAAIDSAKTAVELCINLLGIMCLWAGFMKIAEKSGLVDNISKIVRPVMKILFPGIPARHPAMGAVVMNLVANMLGLGNAATPLGIKAMEEMQKINPDKDTATDSMSMFLVLNTSVIQLIPASIIAVRASFNSLAPSEIIGTIWMASACASIAGIIATKLLGRMWRKRADSHTRD